jgi:membrane associated rhomboid family serine protease
VIPLRDDVPSRTIPVVNYGLIALNVLFFLGELGLGADLERLFFGAAVIPVLYTGADHVFEGRDLIATVLDSELRTRVLLSMFLHGGWAHLLGNMLYLWIFGDNVEDRCGHFKYLAFYLLCGYAATWGHIWSDPRSRIPSIGASGAIAGVLGAYISLYPRARVVTLLPLGFFFPLIQVPAVFFLGFWFLQQFLFGLVDSGAPGVGGGVAWWAHVCGFVAGLALVWVFQSRKRRPAIRRDLWWEDYAGERPARRRGF